MGPLEEAARSHAAEVTRRLRYAPPPKPPSPLNKACRRMIALTARIEQEGRIQRRQMFSFEQPPEIIRPATGMFVKPTWREITQAVCLKHKVAFAEIVGETHERRVCFARREAWHRIRDELGMSMAAIGRKFNRDHSTIYNGLKRWDEAHPQ